MVYLPTFGGFFMVNPPFLNHQQYVNHINHINHCVSGDLSRDLAFIPYPFWSPLQPKKVDETSPVHPNWQEMSFRNILHGIGKSPCFNREDLYGCCLSIYVMLVLRGVRLILGLLAPQKTNMSPEAWWLGSMKFPFVLRPLFCESVLRVLIYVDI